MSMYTKFQIMPNWPHQSFVWIQIIIIVKSFKNFRYLLVVLMVTTLYSFYDMYTKINLYKNLLMYLN